MTAETIIEKLVRSVYDLDISVDGRLINTVRLAILATIPNGLIEEDIPSYVKLSQTDEKQKMEVSLLTPDHIVNEYTFTNEGQEINFSDLHSSSFITYNVFMAPASDKDQSTDISPRPFRAELGIFNGNQSHLIYKAEGSRPQVASLRKYSVLCLRALHRTR